MFHPPCHVSIYTTLLLRFSLTGFDVVPGIIEKMNDAGIKCFHPDDCPGDLDADIVLLSVPTPLIKETQRLDMKVRRWTTCAAWFPAAV